MRLSLTLPAVLLALPCLAGLSRAEEPPLLDAVRSGNLHLVALLLEKDPAAAADVSLVRLAAINGHEDVAEFLLDRGARIDIFVAAGLGMTGRVDVILESRPLLIRARTSDGLTPLTYAGLTPLHLAARNGHTATTEVLLAHAAPVGVQDWQGHTPLHLAAAHGRAAVAALLLDRGARAGAADDAGRTPLHEAARYGRREVTKLLLTSGADVNARQADHGTPLHDAAAAGQTGTVALLLARGADADAATLDGRTPLHLAILSEDESQDQEAVPEEGVDRRGVVVLLLKQDIDLDARDETGKSPLDYALEKGRTDLADLLADRGAALDVCQAIRLGKKDRVAALLAEVGDRPAKDRETAYRVALECAAEVGDVDSVRVLVARGADPRDGLGPAAREGNTAVVELLLDKVREEERAGAIGWGLGVAVEHGQTELAERLLGRGASLDGWADGEGRTLLHRAAEDGNPKLVRLLLTHKADVRAVDRARRTPLHAAAVSGDPEVLRLLLKRGAPVDAADRLGMTALHIAANRGLAEAVRILLTHKANVNPRDNEGRTPLHWAAGYGQKDAVRALLDGHADVNARDNRGRTPLLYAARVQGPFLCGTALHAAFPAFFPSQPNEFVAAAELLIEHKAGVDAADNAGVTSVEEALGGPLQEPDTPMLKLLLERGAAADIFALVAFGPADQVRARLERSPRLVGSRDKDGQTPLHIAAAAGRIDIVKLLLEKNPRLVELRGKGDQTPLHIAAAAGRNDIVKLLLASGADRKARAGTDRTTPLYEAAVRGHAEVVRTLLAHDPLGRHDDEGPRLLHEAAERGHVGVVQALLTAGVDANARGWEQSTPLHWAARWGHGQVVDVLLAHGARANARTAEGETPLHWAVEKRQEDAVLRLLAGGADVNVRNQEGDTPLHWAATGADLVYLLLSAGAEVNPRDADGMTPLYLAVHYGSDKEAIDLLRRHGGTEERSR
jgi:ankyrin repeat protein